MGTVLVCTANPLLDHLADTELVPGRMNRCAGFQAVAGGKGLNVGRVLVRHGHRVLACGFAGGSTGHRFRGIVAAEGQTCHFTETAADLRVGFLARDCAGAGTTALMENGFAVSPTEYAACLRTIASLLPLCDLAICSGSVGDPDTCTGLYADLASRCAAAGVPCWVDSYGAPMDAALNSADPPALVKPNREEWAASHDWDRAAECHISDGAKRLEVRSRDAALAVRPPPVRAINPVGSGDSYLAALAHARLVGMDLHDQCRYAVAAGALNAASMTVADLDPRAIGELADTVTVEAL